jgi:RHS repeat-associated protein
VVGLVDEDGKVVNRYSYDEWGNLMASKEEIDNPIRYSGEYYDEETGLYYLRARYYDPTIGRFISEDSYEGSVTNPLSLNQYTYTFNNPLIYVDPSGHNAIDIVAGWAYATDEDWFAGAAQGITGKSASDYMYNEDFYDAYVAAKITNKAYSAYSIGSSLGNIAGGARGLATETGQVITSAGAIVKEEGLHLAAQTNAFFSKFNGGQSVNSGRKGKNSQLTPRQLNKYKEEVLNGNDIEFKTREEAIEFVNKKFHDFSEEVAGSRSAKGWHFDSHPINGSENAIDHINIYSKKQKFRVHITWRD